MKIGIIGTSWGLMHVGGFRAAGADVVALCGRQPEKTRAIAEREGIPLATVDPAELCSAADLVVVASPDALHARHVRAALDQERPVLCEKPLATSDVDAERMADWARRSGRLCAVNFPYRMLPPVAHLRSHIAGRKVKHIACTVYNSFAAAATDASGDFGGVSHLIDTALWLAGGAAAWVQASLSERPVQSAALHIGLSTGAVLVVTQLASSVPGIRGFWSVLGDSWEASFAGGYVPDRGGWCISPLRLSEDGTTSQVGEALEPVAGQREPWAEAHAETARHVLRTLGDGRPGPLALFEDGLAVQRVLAAALESDERMTRVNLTAVRGRTGGLLFHLVGRHEWARAEEAGEYAPASLAQEGFIHFSTDGQLARTAQRFFAGRDDLLVVAVRQDLLTAPLRFDEVDGEPFPHLYGSLNLDAVIRVAPWVHP